MAPLHLSVLSLTLDLPEPSSFPPPASHVHSCGLLSTSPTVTILSFKVYLQDHLLAKALPDIPHLISSSFPPIQVWLCFPPALSLLSTWLISISPALASVHFVLWLLCNRLSPPLGHKLLFKERTVCASSLHPVLILSSVPHARTLNRIGVRQIEQPGERVHRVFHIQNNRWP